MNRLNSKIVHNKEEKSPERQNNIFKQNYRFGEKGLTNYDRQGSRLWNWNAYMEKTLLGISTQKKTSFKVIQDNSSLQKMHSMIGNPEINSIQLKKIQKQKEQPIQYSQQSDHLSEQDYKNNNEDNIQTSLLKMDSQVRIRRGFSWKVSSGILKGGQIMFFITHYKISLIQKLKVMTESIDQTQFHTIKFNYGNQCIYFGAPIDNFCMKINCHFGWFIGIIMHKLNSQKSIQKPIFKQNRVRLSKQTDFKYSGPILKRSQYLGRWCQRWVVVNEKGLFFYNLQYSSQKYTFCISSDHIKYIWTRFQIYNNCLVLKVKHGIRKTQLGFPVVDLFEKNFSWLLQLYNLMMFRK